jgi:hypothetical protein
MKWNSIALWRHLEQRIYSYQFYCKFLWNGTKNLFLPISLKIPIEWPMRSSLGIQKQNKHEIRHHRCFSSLMSINLIRKKDVHETFFVWYVRYIWFSFLEAMLLFAKNQNTNQTRETWSCFFINNCFRVV